MKLSQLFSKYSGLRCGECFLLESFLKSSNENKNHPPKSLGWLIQFDDIGENNVPSQLYFLPPVFTFNSRETHAAINAGDIKFTNEPSETVSRRRAARECQAGVLSATWQYQNGSICSVESLHRWNNQEIGPKLSDPVISPIYCVNFNSIFSLASVHFEVYKNGRVRDRDRARDTEGERETETEGDVYCGLRRDIRKLEPFRLQMLPESAINLSSSN